MFLLITNNNYYYFQFFVYLADDLSKVSLINIMGRDGFDIHIRSHLKLAQTTSEISTQNRYGIN